MPKQSKNAPELDSGLENDLIQGANDLPGDADPIKADVTPLPQIAAAANLALPAQVPEPKQGLPAIVSPALDAMKPSIDVPQYQNDPATITPQELHEQRVKRYGTDYVVVNKGKAQQVFTGLAWKQMRGDKFGWREAVQVPMEVRNLQSK